MSIGMATATAVFWMWVETLHKKYSNSLWTFREHSSSFGILERDFNGTQAQSKKSLFEILTALNLLFSLVPNQSSIAAQKYSTLCNDLISSWQEALLDVLLITILQREGEEEEDRLHWLTSTFATLLNPLEANTTQIVTSAESFDGAAANHYWCLVVWNAHYWWFNLDEKTSISETACLLNLLNWTEQIPAIRYIKTKGKASQKRPQFNHLPPLINFSHSTFWLTSLLSDQDVILLHLKWIICAFCRGCICCGCFPDAVFKCSRLWLEVVYVSTARMKYLEKHFNTNAPSSL